MRALLVLIVVVVVLVCVGWVTIRTNGNHQATVTVETEKIQKDTHDIVEKGEAAVEKAGKKIHESVEKHQD